MDFGNSFYSEPFDMKGAKSLLFEARLVSEPPDHPAHAILHVQGSDDGGAENKNWVCGGSTFDLPSGSRCRAVLGNMRETVRVKGDFLPPWGPGRIEVRLTRLP